MKVGVDNVASNIDDSTLNAIKEHFRKIQNAKTEPSPTCKDGGEHRFQAIGHGDGRTHFSWIFECKKCGEVVEKRVERTGEGAEFWR